MKADSATNEELANRLRSAGLRLTAQRLAVYRALLESRLHPTAGALYDHLHAAMPALSRATVYNTLRALVGAGLVYEIGAAGDGTTHYDADLHPHLNLVCTNCGHIEDYYDPALLHLESAVVAASGYRVKGARMAYYGMCPDCAEATDGED